MKYIKYKKDNREIIILLHQETIQFLDIKYK